MNGAIVQEWIAESGGSERVFDEFARMFPDARLYTLWSDRPAHYPSERLTESWIARTSLRRSKVAALPFMLPTWRTLRSEDELDWLVVSSHLFAHHAKFRGPSRHAAKLVYAHTPARYIWQPDLDTRGSSLGVRAMAELLKPIDRYRAQEAISIATNSAFTRERIRRCWNRDATVIYPPVDVSGIQSVASWADLVEGEEQHLVSSLPDAFILGASRFVPYKRLDAAINAGVAASMPVVIAGYGPDEMRLRAAADRAAVPVHFISKPSDALLRALYERATVYVFAAVEDFGIMPVEAMALGTPVVTIGVGGAAESVIDGTTGAVTEGLAIPQLARAVERATGCDRAMIRAEARRFDRSNFVEAAARWVDVNTRSLGRQDVCHTNLSCDRRAES